MQFRLEQSRVVNLIAMIPNLPDEQRQIAIQDAFESGKSWMFGRGTEDLLTPLAPYLTDDMRKEVLQLARAYEDKETGMFIMGRLIAFLSESEKDTIREQALEMAKAIDAEYGSRASWLTWLLPHLDKLRGAEAVRIGVRDAIQMIHKYGFNVSSASVLETLWPLAENQDEILRTLRECVADQTIKMQNATRATALQFCGELGKLMPPSVSSEIHGMIVSTILEICENWRWL